MAEWLGFPDLRKAEGASGLLPRDKAHRVVMDGVFEEGVALDAPSSLKGAVQAGRNLLACKIRHHARFLRTIGYATGFTLCALGVVARLVASDARNAARPQTQVAAAQRQADPGPRLSRIPLPPQPAALIDHALRPDLSMASPADRAEPSPPNPRAATSYRNGLSFGTSGRPRSVASARAGAGPHPRLAGRTLALRGVTRPRSERRSDLASASRAAAAGCPACDCKDLYNKRFFTLEPLRTEEQAWYAARCAR